MAGTDTFQQDAFQEDSFQMDLTLSAVGATPNTAFFDAQSDTAIYIAEKA